MIKAVAIDDEPLALQVISALCERSSEINLVKTFTKPKEGLKYVNNFPVDLLFVDIQMPSMLGTELVKNLKQKVIVVFTTAYENFALDGFNLNAVDYLLKPFSYERFQQALEKVKKVTGNQNVAWPEKAFITVRADYSLIRIELDRIKYFEGLDDYIKIHLIDSKPIVTRFTMKSMLESLPVGMFIRVHRSFIVPVNRITSLKNKTIFLGDIQIPVGNSYEASIEGFFSN